jgi:hypothetical protein
MYFLLLSGGISDGSFSDDVAFSFNRQITVSDTLPCAAPFIILVVGAAGRPAIRAVVPAAARPIGFNHAAFGSAAAVANTTAYDVLERHAAPPPFVVSLRARCAGLAFTFSDDVDDMLGAKVHAVTVLSGDNEGTIAQPPDILIPDTACDFDPYSLASDAVPCISFEDHFRGVAWLQAVAVCFVWYLECVRVLGVTFFC